MFIHRKISLIDSFISITGNTEALATNANQQFLSVIPSVMVISS